MRPGFGTRRCLQLALTANALYPRRGPLGAIPSFVAGWPAGELAPQLLGLNAADTALHLLRHGTPSRGDRIGLAASALSSAGAAALIAGAHRARGAVEDALVEALGSDYRQALHTHDEQGTRPRALTRPWNLRDPLVRRDRDIAYAPGGERFLLDVYRPREGGSNMPVLLQIHGGAWMLGSKDEQGLPLMMRMARRGWTCVSINYPLSPAARWPDHVVGAKRALAWIKDTIHAYGGDPAHVAVTGGSAGGHLAALLALTPGDPRFQPGFTSADTSVQACVPLYGVYDFAASSGSRASTARMRRVLAPYVVGHDPSSRHDEYLAASPLDRITASAPPTFVLHGTHDTLIPVTEARRFAGTLRERSQAPVAYAELPGAQHAFDLFTSIRSTHVTQGVARFLEYTHNTS